LAEHAVSIARTLDDPETLASCLSQHDVPGIAPPAPRFAATIIDLAEQADDQERHA